MAQHFDLEQQEKLDELKHFWKNHRQSISATLIVAVLLVAAASGWQYWQHKKATQASSMYDEVERLIQAGDTPKIERALNDMKERFAGVAYTDNAVLLAARAYYDKGDSVAAQSALGWLAITASDVGYQALARLRLAGIFLENKAYDQALSQLSWNFPPEFSGLAYDRRGDVFMAQDKKSEAKAEYQKAYKELDENTQYKRLVEVKLSALGGDLSVAPPIPASKVEK